jgi:ABC-2 type transport system ATP-binding protein/lipopolysaccharide transport system ATP-binding protein
MPLLQLDHVDVEFPLYSARGRSFKARAMAMLHQKTRQSIERNRDLISVQSLRDISVTLRDGDRLGLVGRNGAGKSTLLRVMSGIYEPVQGNIDIQGSLASMTDMSMGMDPEATGFDNIVLRGVFLGLSHRQARAQIPQIAAWTELGDALDRPLRTYSTGMQVRLAFAVSTTIRPDILIFDEMISAGDAHFIEKARARIHELINSASIMVMASHSDDILRQLCNRAMLMHEGRILLDATVDEVLAAYHRLDH